MIGWWNLVFFTVLNYDVSYLEFIATVFGLLCVFLAARNTIFTWPVGLINIICSYVIYYNVALYSDMFLQIYFFITAMYGWYYWHQQKQIIKKVTTLNHRQHLIYGIVILTATLCLGYLMERIHLYFPSVFKVPAAFPYADTLIAVASIVANLLMAKRILDNWILWIAIDILATYLYYVKGIKFLALEYFIFTILAAYGLYGWGKEKCSYTQAI